MGPGRVVIDPITININHLAITITSHVVATPLPSLIETLPLIIHLQHND
jgi:hypothetical protein